jgi:hypothetical protein
LFRAATVPGLLPSELSPHRDRVPLSRPLTPLRSSTDVPDLSATQPCHHRFPRRPRFRRSCLVPPSAMGSLSTSRGPFPGCPGHAHLSCPFRQLHPLRSFPPPVSPFAPSPGCPGWAAAALLGFFPSRVPFQTSEPRTRRGDSTPALGEAFPLSRATTGQPRRQPPIPFGTGPRRLSTASPSPPALDQRLPAGPGPRSLVVPER